MYIYTIPKGMAMGRDAGWEVSPFTLLSGWWRELPHKPRKNSGVHPRNADEASVSNPTHPVVHAAPKCEWAGLDGVTSEVPLPGSKVGMPAGETSRDELDR